MWMPEQVLFTIKKIFMKNIFCVILISVLLTISSFAQNKKEIKKFKIKSITETLTETADGKEKTFTETFQRFTKDGDKTEDVEYNKNGTFKKKETAKYNKHNDETEKVI